MNPRQVGAAADPGLPPGVVPERFDERPGLAAVGRTKEAARDRPAPQRARLGAAGRFERPDFFELPASRSPLHGIKIDRAFGGLGIDRNAHLVPGRARVGGAMELDAEVAVVERGVNGPVARVGQRHRHVVPQERRAGDLPTRAVALDREQSFASSNEKSREHRRPPSALWVFSRPRAPEKRRPRPPRGQGRRAPLGRGSGRR